MLIYVSRPLETKALENVGPCEGGFLGEKPENVLCPGPRNLSSSAVGPLFLAGTVLHTPGPSPLKPVASPLLRQ